MWHDLADVIPMETMLKGDTTGRQHLMRLCPYAQEIIVPKENESEQRARSKCPRFRNPGKQGNADREILS
jgi:hypothetical protein